MADIQNLLQEIIRFRDERDWEQFHTPRNLAAALSIEAAELQATMLWKGEADIVKMLNDPEFKERVSHEIADVVIYALLLANATNIDVSQAVHGKLRVNAEKYPVDRARGNAAKYTELGDSKEERKS